MSDEKIRGTRISDAAVADEGHMVVSTISDEQIYRKKPCKKCPWRVDAIGEFPPEAFRISANTAYEMASQMFGCHESGLAKPATCAGFLLRGAEHNLRARMSIYAGTIGDDVSDGGLSLHENYRAMAIANGVDPDDPVLANCRD
jgi:hypothetical protein